MYNDTRCPLDVIDAGVGPITDDDVDAAQLFNGSFEHAIELVNIASLV